MVNIIVNNSFRFVSVMLKVRFMVLMHATSYVRRYEHVVLKHLSMDSGLKWRINSGSPRSMYDNSLPKDKAVLRCSQISASMF